MNSNDFRKIGAMAQERLGAQAAALGKHDEPYQLTAKGVLRVLAIIGVVGAIGFWFYIFSTFTQVWPVALVAAVGMALAPPALTAFVIPWSPARQLLARILGNTWGQAFVAGSAVFLVYFATELLYMWWSVQPGGKAGVAMQMSLLMIVVMIIIPALLWTPVMSGDLRRMMREEQLVQEYEIMQRGKIAQLQTTLMRANVLTAKGVANLLVGERQELTGILTSLVSGMEGIQRELGKQVKQVAGSSVPFDNVLPGNQAMREALDQVASELLRLPEPKESETDNEPTDVAIGSSAAAIAGALPDVRMAEPGGEQQQSRVEAKLGSDNREWAARLAAARRARQGGRQLPRD